MNYARSTVRRATVIALAVSSVPFSFGQTPSAAADTEITRLNPFEVRETTDSSSYRATESISASGIALPIRSMPVPIEVVTQSLLEDRGTLDLFSASFLVSGLVTGGPVLTGQESWRLHGYAAPGLRNGFRLDNDTTDTAEVERIEVASGPAAVLYGSGATGGAVNLITKKPKFSQETKLLAGIGTYDFYQARIDSTGPVPGLNRDGKPVLAYRAIASTESSTSDIDWFEKTRNSFNGSLRWQPSQRATFTVEVGSNQRHGRPSIEVPEGTDRGGAIAFNKNPTGRGYQFSINGPDSYDKMRGDNVQVTGDIHILDSVVLHLDYLDHTSTLGQLRARRIDLYGQGKPAQLEGDDEWVDQQLWKANLLWRWDGRLLSNQLILGAEGSRDHDRAIFHRISNWVPPADLRITQAVHDAVFASNPVTNRDRTTFLRAYRVSDFLTTLNGRLHILASVRRDEETNQKELIAKTYNKLEGATTGQIGAVYDLTKGLSPFVNFSNDFVPNTALGPGNAVLAPQRGSAAEGGVKFALLNEQLTGTVSLFNEERSNIPQRIGQTNFFELSGKDRSRGIDFNFIYTPVPAWSFTLGGSFFDAKTISNPADVTQVGLPPQDVCPRSMNFQITFHGERALKGFSAGLGGFWHDDYPTESATTKRHERTDDVIILDAFARYGFKIGRHDAAFTVNVSNLTDKRAYIVNQEAFGMPRVVRAMVSYQF
jgi:iron complex outermembrane receptor protein